jgi:hypothetical protein
MKLRTRVFVLALACLPLLAAGCGEKMPEFGQVEGVVKIKGQPKSGIAVRFLPDPDKGNNLPVNGGATSDDSGKYVLRYSYKGVEGDGAPIGWHRIVLDDTRLASLPQGAPIPPRIIPPDYNSPASTPLTFEIKAGQNTFNIDVP